MYSSGEDWIVRRVLCPHLPLAKLDRCDGTAQVASSASAPWRKPRRSCSFATSVTPFKCCAALVTLVKCCAGGWLRERHGASHAGAARLQRQSRHSSAVQRQSRSSSAVQVAGYASAMVQATRQLRVCNVSHAIQVLCNVQCCAGGRLRERYGASHAAAARRRLGRRPGRRSGRVRRLQRAHLRHHSRRVVRR